MAAVIGLLRALTAPERRKLVAAVVLITALGLWLRLANQAGLREADPLQGAPLLDTAAYEQDAQAMLAGGPFQPPISYRPPGYPWFLALAEAVGFDREQLPALQAALDAITTIGLAALVFSLWSSSALAILAAAIAALSPLLIYFSGERLETSWMVLWVLIHLACLRQALARETDRSWLPCGLSAGFAVLIRPNLLLWLPVLIVGAWRQRSRRAAVFCALGCVLMIAPITLKNLVRGEQFVLVSANGGVNLWLGNVPDPELHGPIPYYEHLPGPVASYAWEQLGKRAYESGAESAAAQSSWHQGTALEEMLSHPLRTAGLMALKLLAFTSAFEMSNNRDLYRDGSIYAFGGRGLQTLGGLEWLQWRLLFPLAFLGAWIALRRKERPFLVWLAGFAGVWTLSVVLFFVCARHRAPIFPAIVPLAIAGGHPLWSWWRARRVPWAPALATLAIALLVNIDWLGHRALYRDYEIDPVGVGRLYRGQRNGQEAESAYKRAIDRNPKDALAIAEYGALRFQQGQPEEAAWLFERSLQVDPSRAESHNYLGLTRMEVGDFRGALDAFSEALEIQPGHGLALANRGRCLLILDRRKEAVDSLRKGWQILNAQAHPLAPQVKELIDEVDREP